jgi:hypothetical protein
MFEPVPSSLSIKVYVPHFDAEIKLYDETGSIEQIGKKFGLETAKDDYDLTALKGKKCIVVEKGEGFYFLSFL